MTPKHPPRLARWILEHLTTDEQKDTLSGDLLEGVHKRTVERLVLAAGGHGGNCKHDPHAAHQLVRACVFSSLGSSSSRTGDICSSGNAVGPVLSPKMELSLAVLDDL